MQIQKIKTSGKKFQDTQKKLKKANAAFLKLTPDEQRVTIAKDVLAQLRTGKFKAGHTYFSFGAGVEDGHDEIEVDDESYEAAVKAKIDMSSCISQVSCTVCGIGSLFASGVLKADKLKVNTFMGASDDRAAQVKYLKQWFTLKQLDLVECFFEQWGYDNRTTHSINLPDDVLDLSPIFQEGDNTERLKMIMQNIVSNNGRFDPFNGKYAVEYQ